MTLSKTTASAGLEKKVEITTAVQPVSSNLGPAVRLVAEKSQSSMVHMTEPVAATASMVAHKPVSYTHLTLPTNREV